MNPALSDTRNSLLLRLQDARDVAAWDQFITIYQPLVFRLARSKGFQESDAHDIVQEVLIAVSQAIHRWDPDREKGRFRDWLFRIARNMMINFLTRRKHQPISSPECISELSSLFANTKHAGPLTRDPETEAEFDLEYRRELFLIAATQVRLQVRPKTWEAFCLTAIENLPNSTVADRLDMKEGAVLVARCRVLARLRVAVASLESNREGIGETQ